MGRSAFYDWYIRHSPEWEKRRRACWERSRRFSHGRCELCLTRSPHAVHHWRGGYENLGHERLDQLLLLCRPCHLSSHFRSEFPPLDELMRLYAAFDPIARGLFWRPGDPSLRHDGSEP